MNRVSCFLFRKLNRLVSRIRGAKGWCASGYQFARTGLPVDDGWCTAGYQFARTGLPEDDGFPAIEPQGRLKAWWGSFMFEYKSLEEV